MLFKLFIQNYAIIEELEINFSGSLNVITGETGAGKSIIAGALGLILGDRADTSVLVSKEKKCIVEGSFNSKGGKISDFIDRNELESGEELVLRREIHTSGKSRAFINDSPVNLSQLNEIGNLLVDLHRQFDTLELSQSDFQREVIDALAGNQPALAEYKSVYQNWTRELSELKELEEKKQRFEKEKDYQQFQFNELNDAGFRENELEEAEAELKILGHAEGIKNTIDHACQVMEENESPVIVQLKSAINQLHSYASIHSAIEVLVKRLESARVELSDVVGELRREGDRIQFDPARMEELNERISLGYRLQKKHGVKSTNELIEIHRQLEDKLQAVLIIDESIQRKRDQNKLVHAKLMTLAGKISEARQKQVKPLEKKVNLLLQKVGMPNAKLQVEIIPSAEAENGMDTVRFLFNANATDTDKNGYQPLKKVASGGELSRLMLCIKSLVAESIDLPVMVFDEIDSGISGEAARQVGLIMKDLAMKRQLICITHQPQIAGKATSHFYVYKEMGRDSIRTYIRELSKEERIMVIAKMIGGEKPTAAAMENAREMVLPA